MPPFIVVLPMHGTDQEGEVGPFETLEEIAELACWDDPNLHVLEPGWQSRGRSGEKPLCRMPDQKVAGEIFEKVEG